MRRSTLRILSIGLWLWVLGGPALPQEVGGPSDVLLKSAGIISEKYLAPIPKDFLLQSALLRAKGALVNPELAQQYGGMVRVQGAVVWDGGRGRGQFGGVATDPAKTQQFIKKIDEVYAFIRQKPDAPDTEIKAQLDGLFALNRTLEIAPDSLAVRAGLNGMLIEVNGRLDQGDAQGGRFRHQNEQSGRIGIQLNMEDAGARVGFVYPNSAAQQAGVQQGDLIVKIDGKETKGRGLDAVMESLRGKPGAKVILTVQREGLDKPKDIEITRTTGTSWGYRWARSKFVSPDSKIGYVRFSPYQMVQEGREEDLDDMVQELAAQGMAGLILDLRWGQMESFVTAAAMADHLVGGEWTLMYDSRSGLQKEKRAAKPAEAYPDVPMVVLVDRNTFGPPELMAAAVKATGRGLVIGDTTQGRAVGQLSFTVPGSEYGLKFAAAIYRTPKGEEYQGKGIEPDIRVMMDNEDRNRIMMRMQREDYGQQAVSGYYGGRRQRDDEDVRDVQLDKAIEYLGGSAVEAGPKKGETGKEKK